jgi:hypothetical protein
MPNELIDATKVRKEMECMIDMITHPAFVAAMKLMKETPISGRQELGKKTLTVKALKAQGVKLPEGMRVTTRYFEQGRPDVLEVDPDGEAHVTKSPLFMTGSPNKLQPGAVAWGGCACGGGLSFCGGAGGST